MNEIMKVREIIKGKRILGIDFGLKRVGTAITDEMHITLNPKKVFDYTDRNFYKDLNDFIISENIGVIVVGVPYTSDNKNADLIDKINNFIKKIHDLTGKDVFQIDEAYTSKDAIRTMIETGRKKKFRAKKGETDKVAAALILKEFLSIYENYPTGM